MTRGGPRPDPAGEGEPFEPYILGQLDEDGDLTAALPEELEGGEHRRYTLSRDAKERLDKYLHNRLKATSRHQVQKLIALGGVTVNGKMPKPSTHLHAGDVVDVIVPPRPEPNLNPEPIPLDILYEDDGFIVVNKQAGLIVHPARSHLSGTLLNALAYHFQQHAGVESGQQGLSDVGRAAARPGVIHRLDKNTTGVIVVAKQPQPHFHLARQFEDRTNLKAYLAVVHGCPDPVGGVIDQPLGKHPTVREAYAVRHDSQGKPSVTIYRVRERYGGYSLVELELKTGRTHQIRVHLSYIGCPIVGDIIYGGEPVGWPELENPPLAAGARPNLVYARSKEEGLKIEQQTAERDDIIMPVPALHAAMLQVVHPKTGQLMTFTAPIHSPMRELIHELRRRPDDGPVVDTGCWIDLDEALPS